MADNLRVGDHIPLRAQLKDSTSDRVIKATLRKADGTTYGSTVTLPHVGGGLYLNTDVLMPATTSITATYITYETDGTTEDVTYSRVEDTFTRLVDDTPVEIIGTLHDGNVISGTIEDLNELSGTVED